MISRSRNDIQTHFRRKMKNVKRAKHKRRNEKVMDNQRKVQASCMTSRPSQVTVKGQLYVERTLRKEICAFIGSRSVMTGTRAMTRC